MVGEEGLGLVVLDGNVDDDILTLLPVDGGDNLLLVAELERVNGTVDLILESARQIRVIQPQ